MGKADISVNNWLEEKERFADLFNGVIFEGKQVIQPNELEKISPVTSVSTKNRRGKRRNVKKYRDVIMKWKNEIALVLLANESQDKIHYAMPPKVMIYDSLDYEEQMRENWNKVMTKRKADKTQGNEMEHLTAEEYLSRFRKKDKLIPVISLVLYYGEEEWDGPLCLTDMLSIPEKWKELVSDYKMNLIQVRESGVLKFQNGDVDTLFKMVRLIYNKKYAELGERYKGKPIDAELALVIGAVTNSQRIINQALISEKKGKKMNMCKALEELEQRGISKGIKQGIKQGISEGREEMLRDLVEKKLQKGKSVEEIADALEQEYSVIQRIVDELKMIQKVK